MASSWAFGNTTVRNPLRIRGGLCALYESPLNGYLIDKVNERRFAELLNTAGVVEIKDRSRDYSDMGRKWRSCFSQLGFITHKFDRATLPGQPEALILQAAERLPGSSLSGRPYEVTPSGRRLIAAESVQQQQECMLRALLAYEVPSEIERGNGNEPFQPLYFMLQLLTVLLERTGTGVNDAEMAILQTIRTHEPAGIRAAVEHILECRRRCGEIRGTTARRAVERAILEPLATAGNIQLDTLKTYTDSNFRYLRYTGLFSYQGKRLVLNPEKQAVVRAILERDPELAGGDRVAYLARLWNGAPLPTDSEASAAAEIARYRRLLLAEGIAEAALPRLPAGADIADMTQLRLLLEELHQNQLERRYAEAQREEPNLSETIAYLKSLDNQKDEEARSVSGIDDKAAYLEWAVWRALLAMGSPANPPYEARRFRVDQDFFPMGCAPGRGPDMLFLFEEFALVVEVTLTASSRQEAAEGEPVRRHVAVEKSRILKEHNLPVYGLFLAGSIDNNTAETFRIGVWYNGDNPEFINIVPLTLRQFIAIMELLRRERFPVSALRGLLDTCLIPRNAHAPAWKREIARSVDAFVGGSATLPC